MRKVTTLIAVLVVITGVLFALVSCGEQAAPEEKFFGPEIANKEEYVKATVNDVFANSELMEKNIVLEVYMDDVCPAGCWFFLKDGPDDKVKLYVSRNREGFTVPETIEGKKVRVYGKVNADSSGEILEGHRVELIN